MPKFLVGCHHNEEEISQHLKENIRYWLVHINDNWSNPEKTGRSCEGANFSWLSSKVSWTLILSCVFSILSRDLKFILNAREAV
jgi:hypothetical protein